MKRARTPRFATLAVTLLLAGLTGACSNGGSAIAGAPARNKPQSNIVLIVVDTLRGDIIVDSERAHTPNIDALAADGLLFERAFSHAPITLPAHTSLFSSRPPFETGVMNNAQPASG